MAEPEYILSKPPHLRTVDCCATCKHSIAHYEGAFDCGRFRRSDVLYGPEGEPYRIDVAAWHICDDFDREEPARG